MLVSQVYKAFFFFKEYYLEQKLQNLFKKWNSFLMF